MPRGIESTELPTGEELFLRGADCPFPSDNQAINQRRAEIEGQHPEGFPEDTILNWAVERGLIGNGEVVLAEISPTLRCSEACPGCPDSSLLLQEAITKGLAPKVEARASVEVMTARIKRLYDFGVRHFMFIGGTIDGLPETPILINFALSLDQAVRVSWFSDGIMQTDNDGDPAALFKRNVESGWIQKVASHVSMDYPYAGDIGSVFQDDNLPQTLPTKKGRGTQFANDPEQSRKFKSQYGLAFAVNLIREGVRRVVINTTVSTRNVDQVQAIYHQVSELQAFAEQIDSPTEVCWTFSPWIWRPHQARGDDPSQSPATLGLQLADMPAVNDVFSTILSDTHQRIAEDRPRVLANSAGFTQLLTDPSYRELVVNQDVPVGNRPVALQVNPDALVGLDPMFQGPEIFGPGAPQLRTLFGYLDRDPRRERNIFSKYSNPDQEWFPNIVAT